MPKTNTDELRARVDAFVADLSEIIRVSALESVRVALGDGSAAPVRRGRKPGRPAKATKSAGRKAAKRGGRVRRSSEDLGQLSDSFLSYVKANPGQRLEQIGVGMRTDTKELKRPVQLLLESGSLRTEGQRRGTKYFAGSGKSAKGKVSKKKASKRGKRKATKAKRKGSKKAAAASMTTAKAA